MSACRDFPLGLFQTSAGSADSWEVLGQHFEDPTKHVN